VNDYLVEGERYLVLKDFDNLSSNDHFTVGDILTFSHSAYNRYDSETSYFFKGKKENEIFIWDLSNRENPEIIDQYFLKIIDTSF